MRRRRPGQRYPRSRYPGRRSRRPLRRRPMMRRRPMFMHPRPFYRGYYRPYYGSFFWTRRLWRGFTYLLMGGLAYKMLSPDVNRIEEYSGSRVEEMSEDDLKESMARLGIRRLELTPEDEERLGYR